jgi:hypothetical protein
MHADVELGDSPTRQHVLEVDIFRPPAVKVFQRSHARFFFLCARFAPSARTKKDLSAVPSLQLLSNRSTQSRDSKTCSWQPRACAPLTVRGRQNASAEVTHCGECRASRCKPRCSFLPFLTSGTARMRARTSSHAAYTVHRQYARVVRECFSPS